jgi:S1-C subfamily serine protease
MRVTLTVLFAILLTASTPTASSLADFTALMESVRAIQRPVDDDDGYTVLQNVCTATSINAEKHYWLTAAHCVEQETLVSNHIAISVFKDDDADVAVLHTPHYSRPALKLRPTAPTVSLSVTVASYPAGLSVIQLFSGRVSSLRTPIQGSDYMMFDLTVCQGSSGSAVVDENNQIISVVQVAFGFGCSQFSGGVPWENLVRLVSGYVEPVK